MELTAQLNAKMSAFEKTNIELKMLLDGKIDIQKMDALSKANEKIGADVVKLNEELEKFQLKMKHQESNNASFSDILRKSISPEELKNIRGKGQSGRYNLDINPIDLLKADMTAGTNLTFGTFANSVPEPFRTPGVAKAPDRLASVLDMVNIGQLAPNQPRLTWVERSARTAGAAARAEGGVMGNSDFTYISRSTDVINISTYVKTTNESLEYWDQLLSEIRMELVPMLQRKLDDYLLTGASGQTPAQIVGLANLVNAYTYTGLNDFVAAPTTADAVYAALTQVTVNNYKPNGILMHPTDVAKMWLTKDNNHNSQYNMTVDMTGNILVGGVPVKINTGIGVGYLLVGDFTKASVWFRKGIDVRIWDQNEDDAIYGNKTITADMSAAFKVPVVNYNAFVYDQISDIVTILTT